MKYNIPFIKPSFPGADVLAEDYKKIVESNWYTNFGPFEKEFSNKIESFIGNGVHAATVSNATLGLMAAIMATLGRGDNSQYIIMPSFTFVAGAQAIIWSGYKPYFVDISTDSLQMDIALAEAAMHELGEDTAAILFCNAFGVGEENIKAWEDLATSSKKPLIIDSAAGFGSEYKEGEYLGSRGTCEVFSFHATKPFGVGEGGAVTSKDPELIKRIKNIQNFGFDNNRSASLLGINAKMQEINAAIGLRQLENFRDRLTSRQKVHEKYVEALSGLVTFQTNAEKSSVCFASVLLPEKRDVVVSLLNGMGISVREYYNPPIAEQEYFIKNPNIWNSGDLSVSNKVSRQVISLPVHDYMSTNDVNIVVNELKSQL